MIHVTTDVSAERQLRLRLNFQRLISEPFNLLQATNLPKGKPPPRWVEAHDNMRVTNYELSERQLRHYVKKPDISGTLPKLQSTRSPKGN